MQELFLFWGPHNTSHVGLENPLLFSVSVKYKTLKCVARLSPRAQESLRPNENDNICLALFLSMVDPEGFEPGTIIQYTEYSFLLSDWF